MNPCLSWGKCLITSNSNVVYGKPMKSMWQHIFYLTKYRCFPACLKGQSLPELLVSIAVTTTIVGGLFPVIGQMYRVHSMTADRTAMERICENALERLSGAKPALTPGSRPMPPELFNRSSLVPNATGAYEISAGSLPGLWEVTARVQYTNCGVSRQCQLRTLMYRPARNPAP